MTSGENSQAEKGTGARSGVAAAACGSAALGRALEQAGSGQDGVGGGAIHWDIIEKTTKKQLRRFGDAIRRTRRDLNRRNSGNEKQSVHAETECTSSRIVEKCTGLKASLYPNSKVMRYTDLQTGLNLIQNLRTWRGKIRRGK